jgi:hypothetical protein
MWVGVKQGFQKVEILEIDVIWASSGHATLLDPISRFLEIIRHKPQWGNPDRSRDKPRRVGSENLRNLCE